MYHWKSGEKKHNSAAYATPANSKIRIPRPGKHYSETRSGYSLSHERLDHIELWLAECKKKPARKKPVYDVKPPPRNSPFARNEQRWKELDNNFYARRCLEKTYLEHMPGFLLKHVANDKRNKPDYLNNQRPRLGNRASATLMQSSSEPALASKAENDELGARPPSYGGTEMARKLLNHLIAIAD